MPQEKQTLILRLFGLSQQQVYAQLKAAADAGCPGLNLMQKGAEYAVCVSASGQNAAATLAKWEAYFKQAFGAAVFATGEQGLAQSTITALCEGQKLFVAADPLTGRLLETLLKQEKNADIVYDFGSQSYAHPKAKEQLVPSQKLLQKYPDCPVQPVAGVAAAAAQFSTADYAVAYRPARSSGTAFVLVYTKRQVYVKPMDEKDTEQQAAEWLLDMVRRLVLGLPQMDAVRCFAYGQAAPPLGAVAEAVPAPQSQQTQPQAPKPNAINTAEDLFGVNQTEPKPELDENGYPEMQHKRRFGRTFLVLLLVALIAGGIAAWQHWGSRPSAANFAHVGYGTADYDTAVWQYLHQQQEKDGNIAAYLALPKLQGSLIYGPSNAASGSGPIGAVFAEEASTEIRVENWQFAGEKNANLVVDMPSAQAKTLADLASEDTIAENSGFTLYADDVAYRYKILSVFYWDETETGAAALDIRNLQDLSNHDTFLQFALNAKARSLFTMPASVQDDDSFATLIVPNANSENFSLVVVGRLVRINEAAILFGNQITTADEPLMPMASYLAAGSATPDLTILKQYWSNWYATGGETASDVQEHAGMPDVDVPLDPETDPENPDATPDPDASPNPDASASPSPSGSPTPKPTGTATPKPTGTATPKPTGTATPKPTGTATPKPTTAPTQAPTPTPTLSSGSTITVTMNGVRQEMDLVECLAMVARNELGANAPYEAYKAQMVATRSWILSQSGAPSVVGLQPSENIRNAAREVASQVLTYNGSVAFTPYFASAAYGTNSSQEVWGGVRPYLINVDSPHDQNYASNWKNTRTYTVNEVAIRAQDRLGVDLKAYNEDPATWMGDLSKNGSGYVNSMRIGALTISGATLRDKVLNNVNGKTLRSAAFDIVYNAEAQTFEITTCGYGHGCGLSQYGAWGYAAQGWNYKDILAHYFPGTSLETR